MFGEDFEVVGAQYREVLFFVVVEVEVIDECGGYVGVCILLLCCCWFG